MQPSNVEVLIQPLHRPKPCWRGSVAFEPGIRHLLAPFKNKQKCSPQGLRVRGPNIVQVSGVRLASLYDLISCALKEVKVLYCQLRVGPKPRDAGIRQHPTNYDFWIFHDWTHFSLVNEKLLVHQTGCDRILIVPHTILSNWTPSKIMKTKHWVSVTAAYLLLQAPFLSPVVPVFIVSCPLPRYVLGLTSLQLSNTFDKCCGSKLEISQPCTWTDIASKRSWCPQERRDAVREAQPSTRDCNNSIPRSIQPAKRLVITPL